MKTGLRWMMIVVLMLMTASSHAALILSVEEVGSDVVITTSGSLDVSALSGGVVTGGGGGSSHVVGELVGYFYWNELDLGGGLVFPFHAFRSFEYYIPTYPGAEYDIVSWGSAGEITVSGTLGMIDGSVPISSRTGDLFGFEENPIGEGRFILPTTFTSGDTINSETVFAGQTLESMGFTPGGGLTMEWGSGSNADSFVVTVVPEPATAGLLGLSSLLIFVIRRLQKAYGLR